jgi:hypothetical protein
VPPPPVTGSRDAAVSTVAPSPVPGNHPPCPFPHALAGAYSGHAHGPLVVAVVVETVDARKVLEAGVAGGAAAGGSAQLNDLEGGRWHAVL